MYGRFIGSLKIKVNGATKLTRNGDHGNKWIADMVDISGTNVKVAIKFLILYSRLNNLEN